MGIKSLVHLGQPVITDDGRVVIYAIAHANLVAYRPYAIVPAINTEDLNGDGSADNDGKAITAAIATQAALRYKGAPQRAYAEGEVAEILVGGAGKLNVGAATVAAENFLEVLNTATTAINAGSNAAEAFAYACEGNGDAAKAINVQFLGVPSETKAT